MDHQKVVGVIAAVAMLGLAGCGSSGSGTSSSTPADATSSVDSVSVNLNNLDASQSSASANISASKSLGAKLKGFGSSVGSTSRAGCELNEIKKESRRIGNEIDAILCYLGTTQDSVSSFVVDGTQRFYTLTVPVSDDGNFTMAMRVIKDSDGLRMDMCEGGVLSEEITIDQNDLAVTASGYHHFVGESGGPGAGFEDKGGFDLTLALKSSAAGEITYDDIDSGTLAATFVGNFGSGRMTFGKTASADLNDISGVFAASLGSNDTFTAQIVGRTDATQGTAKYSVTGTFPALPKAYLPAAMQSLAPSGFCPMTSGFDSCDPATNFMPGGSCVGQTPTLSCFCMQAPTDGKCTFTDSGTESFAITTNSTTGAQTFAIVAGSDANYFSVVDAMSLPLTTIATPTPTRNWDCSTTGQTVVALDLTGVNYSVCDAKASKGFDSSDKDSCHEQESADKVESGSEEFEN
jgi:hypothetical protein